MKWISIKDKLPKSINEFLCWLGWHEWTEWKTQYRMPLQCYERECKRWGCDVKQIRNHSF
jgi:hypothetical protein